MPAPPARRTRVSSIYLVYSSRREFVHSMFSTRPVALRESGCCGSYGEVPLPTIPAFQFGLVSWGLACHEDAKATKVRCVLRVLVSRVLCVDSERVSSFPRYE